MSKRNNKTIVVTGATGHQGGAALRHLRERGFPVRALTRNPDRPEARRLMTPGTELVRGDQTDPASLARAMEDVSGVFSVQESHGADDSEVQQGTNEADAANRAGVNHLVYSSVASADQNTGIPHFETKFRLEEHLRRTGLRHTIFRPVFFMENLLNSRDAVEQGFFTMPLAPQTRLQMVAVDDIGAHVAMAFERPGHWENRALELAGDELSMEEIAAALSLVSGHPVEYKQVPWEDFEKGAGAEITTMFRWFEREGFRVDIAGVRKERPQMLTLEHWLRLNWPRPA